MKPLNGYFPHIGSKNNSGLVQFIINLIPEHETFIEAFAGSAVIARNVYDGQRVILIDKDPMVCELLLNQIKNEFDLINDDFIKALKCPFDLWTPKDVFIYADPPYPISSRKGQKELYNCEMTDDQHIELLNLLNNLDCNIMISTRENDIYNKLLKDWTKLEYETIDRGGKAIEQIFINYSTENLKLFTYKFIGKNFTERQYFKRKKANFFKKLKRMSKEQPQLYQSIIKDLNKLIK